MPSATGGQASFLDQANGLHETFARLHQKLVHARRQILNQHGLSAHTLPFENAFSIQSKQLRTPRFLTAHPMDLERRDCWVGMHNPVPDALELSRV